MAIASVASFIETLRQSRLLEPAQLNELAFRLPPALQEPRALAKELIGRGWLTPYQANQIFQGNARDLQLGAYVLLERLGEGGMGHVFKARHLHMDRIVALKLIRSEHLSDARAVARFQRGIRAAGQLIHPNIVMAYDADRVGDTHFYVMEFVDGIDLGRLVKEVGSLPIPHVCDFLRQAALGLQHAYERGLIHRDIKPANLLLQVGESGLRMEKTSPAAVLQAAIRNPPAAIVKLLDLGLARLHGADTSGPGLTQHDKLLGTPDFIAPEQARDSSKADIRADLYSLGCTFYHLLAGRVPFPGGTSVEKLIRHQMAEPLPVERLRPEIPLEVAQVVRKLMAKRPADRFQTPAELAATLTGMQEMVNRAPLRAAVIPVAAPLQGGAPPVAVALPEPEAATFSAYQPETYLAQWARRTERKPRWGLWLLIVGLVLAAIVGLVLLAWPARERERKAALPRPSTPVSARRAAL